LDLAAVLLQSLLRLASDASDKVRRRALRLFADKAAGLGAELAAISNHLEMGVKQKQMAGDALMDSALQVCVDDLYSSDRVKYRFVT
jgi:hypothetical protein